MVEREIQIKDGEFKKGRKREYERLNRRLIVVETELTMSGYHDGGSLQCLRKEQKSLIERINNCLW